ncbi:MAG: rhomboid family intramembrane serine protease [Acidimicrobiia bacterium]
MLPIRDLNPARRPAVVNWLLVGVTAAIFFFVQSEENVFVPEEEFLFAQAAIPCEVVTGEPLSADEVTSEICDGADANPIFPEKNVLLAIVASIFFHGGIGHLISNLWVLIIFGNNIEDAYGHGTYLVFYLLAGIAATAAHIFLHPESTIPVVGASGSIAGVMGAYAVLHPKARVMSIIPPFYFWPFAMPAFLFLGIWFFSQFLLAGADSNIAWEAHVAGFAFGLLVSILIRRRLLSHSTSDQARYAIGRIRQ